MLKSLKRKLALGSAVAAVATAAVVIPITVASASIPDGSGVIHGCLDNYTSALTVIDSSTASCNSAFQTALDWDQTGPQGATGATGAAGPSGFADVYTLSDTFSVGSGYNGTLTLSCHTGDAVLSGGMYADDTILDEPWNSWPSAAGTWSWKPYSEYGSSGTLYVVCVSSS